MTDYAGWEMKAPQIKLSAWNCITVETLVKTAFSKRPLSERGPSRHR